MIAVDTNVLVRLLAKDDEEQYRSSYKLFQSEEIYISDTVILETEWVLRFVYEFNPAQVVSGLERVFGLFNVHLSNPQKILQVLKWHTVGFDFVDALHLASCPDTCKSFKTFDQKLIKQSKKVTSQRVDKP